MKHILTFVFAIFFFYSNAQIKVENDNQIGIGYLINSGTNPLKITGLKTNSAAQDILVSDPNGIVFKKNISTLATANNVWYEQGTNITPDNIDDNIYTNGNVIVNQGFFKVNNSNPSIQSTVNIETNKNSNPTTSTTVGIRNAATINATNSPLHYQFLNFSNTNSERTVTNIYNKIKGQGTGKWFGIDNTFEIPTTKTTDTYGIYNNFEDNGSGSNTGIWNRFTGTGGGSLTGCSVSMEHTGTNNYLTGYFSNIIKANAQKTQSVDTRVIIEPGASGAVYGFSSFIDGANMSSGNIYGVYSDVNELNNSYAGYFDGPVVLTDGFTTSSDKNLKEDISDVSKSLDKVKKLKAKKYKYKSKKGNNGNGNSNGNNRKEQFHYGFLAQDVQKIIPEIIRTVQRPVMEYSEKEEQELIITYEESLGINYSEIIPFLVGAIQEQQEQIEALQACACGNGNGKSNFQNSSTNNPTLNVGKDIHRSDMAIKLYPNPASQEITLDIDATKEGLFEIKVFDNSGKIITKDQLMLADGKNIYKLRCSEWLPGMYFVNTTHDGVTESHKMIVE